MCAKLVRDPVMLRWSNGILNSQLKVPLHWRGVKMETVWKIQISLTLFLDHSYGPLLVALTNSEPLGFRWI